MSALARRMLAGFGANAFGQAVNVGIQILSLPLFLRRWDLSTYGIWLLLSAIPAYLLMADVGMVTVAGNEMTMAMGRGDVARANRVFQSTLALMIAVCGGLALLAVPIFLLMPLPAAASSDVRTALLALALGVLVALLGGLADAVFKATHRFATGVMVSNLTRLGEWAAGIVGLFVWGTFPAVALCGLFARVAGTIAAIEIARRDEGREIRWDTSSARGADVLSMVRPALSFMAFPLANALSLQGVTLLVGHLFGPASVAVFNAYRTIARVAIQVTSIFSLSLWPEFSRLYGHGGALSISAVYKRSVMWGAWVALGLSVALYPSASWLLRIWTHGKVGFDPLLMGLLLTYAAAGGIWHVPRVLLMSINQHGRLAQCALLSSLALLPAAYVCGRTLGLSGVGLSMLLAEGSLAAVCILLAQRVTQGYAPVGIGAHP